MKKSGHVPVLKVPRFDKCQSYNIFKFHDDQEDEVMAVADELCCVLPCTSVRTAKGKIYNARQHFLGRKHLTTSYILPSAW